MSGIDFSRIRALVIEDDALTRELVVSILESVGLGHIDDAPDGEAAFKRLAASVPDLVVSDVMMEPMDGIAFTRRLRTHKTSPSPHIPVILLTAHTDRTTVIEARSEEHTSELQSLMRISYAVFCLKKKQKQEKT